MVKTALELDKEGLVLLAHAFLRLVIEDAVSPGALSRGESRRVVKAGAYRFLRQAAARDGPERVWFAVVGLDPEYALRKVEEMRQERGRRKAAG